MGKDFNEFEALLGTVAHHQPRNAYELPAFSIPENQFIPNLSDYDQILIGMSGGKDSVACLLLLLELGVPKDKIELHHHNIDGAPSEANFMDWPVTHAYVEALGRDLGIKTLFSWREGGFLREMLRENCGTAPVTFTRGDGSVVSMGGERSKASTRRMFPQVTANLAQRWCSGALKVDVMARLLVNDPRFTNGKTLVVTGERAEESSNRAHYAQFEPDRSDNRNGRVPRWIDHWRAVHQWPEAMVWSLIKKFFIRPHPAYQVGMGRTSCARCIFGSKNQWATLRDIDPDGFKRIADYESEFGKTIHRSLSVNEQADQGTCYPDAHQWAPIALSKEYRLPIFMDPWVLPAGAFGESCGPT